MPDILLDSLIEFAISGRDPGGFLACLLSNDLRGALERADPHMVPEDSPLHQLFICLFNRMPHNCYGSSDKVRQWRDRGGLVGIERESAEVSN